MIAGGVGHFLLVDLGILWGRTAVASWTPSSIVLPALEHTTLDCRRARQDERVSRLRRVQRVGRHLAGAVWGAAVRGGGSARRAAAAADAAVRADRGCFTVVAAVCFIWPPAVGGVLATAFFRDVAGAREAVTGCEPIPYSSSIALCAPPSKNCRSAFLALSLAS